MTKTNTLTIKTPEGIVFSLKLAGPVTRFLAWLVDLASISAIYSVVKALLGILGVVSYDLASAFSILSYFIISIGYGILLEWFWQGRTIGKRLFRLRVMDGQGLKLHFSQVVVRNLLRFVDGLPAFYLVGGMACLIAPKAQRLGDIAANTIVVWTPAIHQPDLGYILSGKFNSFSEYPHLEARLRQRISPAEANIALQALLRRDVLESQARIELFRNITSHIKKTVEFPQEATDGISDEQYIRNVVDALFREKTGVFAG